MEKRNQLSTIDNFKFRITKSGLTTEASRLPVRAMCVLMATVVMLALIGACAWVYVATHK